MRLCVSRLAALLVLFGLASPAVAHPHMFIDTGLEIVFDGSGQATGVRITWTYDELTSMQILADDNMDPEMDGVLTEAELAKLDGFDMNWDPGIPGDTYAQIGAAPLALSRPKDWTIAYGNARITSTHYRSFDAPVSLDDQPLLVQVYDASLYTAYKISYDTKLTGRQDCRAKVVLPDLEAAQAKLAAAIAALPADVENEFPALGADFAEGVRVTCKKPS